MQPVLGLRTTRVVTLTLADFQLPILKFTYFEPPRISRFLYVAQAIFGFVQFFTDPTAKAIFKRRLRYLASRYGSSTSVFSWEFFNEVDVTDGFKTSGNPQFRRIVDGTPVESTRGPIQGHAGLGQSGIEFHEPVETEAGPGPGMLLAHDRLARHNRRE